MRFRRLLLGGLLALGSIACGGNDPDSEGVGTSASAEDDSPYWVAGELPEGFRPVRSDERDGERLVAYQSVTDENDTFDAPLNVVAADAGSAPEGADVERVEVRGRRGYVSELQSDGVIYGVAVSWEQRPGFWLRVEGSEPLTREQVESVANGLVPVSEEDWVRLTRAVSTDTRVGQVDPGAEEVEITSGDVDGDPWTLVGLVPEDYPLADYDQRRTCYRLEFRGDASGDLCDSHPWRLRIGGQVFVLGPAAETTEAVRVGPYGGGEPATDVATVAVERGRPNRFYVLPVPSDTCFPELTADPPDPYLYGSGPLPGDPDHAACLAAVSG